jgi:ribose-phosphate pyrophosphokinase
MKILNLVYPDLSDIQYQVSHFPDGQQSVTLTDVLKNPEVILIKSKLSSFRHLEIIICATKALKNLGMKEIHLYVPYFIGARSDRRFVEGGTHYIKEVIAPIINSQGYESVMVVDPHSDVLEACLNNFRKISNIDLVRTAFTAIDNTNEAREKMVIVSPDAGAMKKIYNVAEHFNHDKIIIAAKHRDVKSGKITHTEVPDLNKYHPHSNFVIIDDICDGGRTFIEIAKVIEAHVWPHDEYFKGKIYLIVTHGIFSAGLYELSKHFERIFCTNSYSDIKAEELSEYTVSNDFLMQTNIYK